MAQYQGVMSGLGIKGTTKESSANLIYPEFDARIRKFIVGANCIIEGLEYNNGVLSAGYCIAEGYIGQLKEQINVGNNKYIYGVFSVKHNKELDSNDLDEFYIVTSDNDLDYENDDILYKAGKYYLPLYPESLRRYKYKFPSWALNSEWTQNVTPSGTLGKDVICPTPSTDSNSQVVANTEFVYNAIEQEIGYAEHSNNYEYTDAQNRKFTITVHLERKANYCYANINFESASDPYAMMYPKEDGIFFTAPSNFRPKELQYLYKVTKVGALDINEAIYINTKGEVIYYRDKDTIGYLGSPFPLATFVFAYKLY